VGEFAVNNFIFHADIGDEIKLTTLVSCSLSGSLNPTYESQTNKVFLYKLNGGGSTYDSSSFASKLSTSVYTADSASFDNKINAKLNTSLYATDSASFNSKIDSKLNTSSFNSYTSSLTISKNQINDLPTTAELLVSAETPVDAQDALSLKIGRFELLDSYQEICDGWYNITGEQNGLPRFTREDGTVWIYSEDGSDWTIENEDNGILYYVEANTTHPAFNVTAVWELKEGNPGYDDFVYFGSNPVSLTFNWDKLSITRNDYVDFLKTDTDINLGFKLNTATFNFYTASVFRDIYVSANTPFSTTPSAFSSPTNYNLVVSGSSPLILTCGPFFASSSVGCEVSVFSQNAIAGYTSSFAGVNLIGANVTSLTAGQSVVYKKVNSNTVFRIR
jgi:hypothetical protein